MQQTSTDFAFYLVPGFSLMALSCAIDVLRAANTECDRPVFRWMLLSENGVDVISSSGIAMGCSPLTDAQKADTITICGGLHSHLFQSAAVKSWLKDEAHKGKRIGALSDGAYVLADAGLFDTTRSTIHWKCQTAYREKYPRLDVRASILEIDGKRFSCAGGTASLDLALHFVSQRLGNDVAGRIADNYFHDTIRADGELQHMASAFRFVSRSKKLSEALRLMDAALETPIQVRVIAEQLQMSHRQLDRLFRKFLNVSPLNHYRDMRLARASALLKQTELSVGEVALSCGFHSASHLSKFLKAKYDETPYQHRRSQGHMR